MIKHDDISETSPSVKSPQSIESEINEEISLEFLKEMEIIMHAVYKDTIHCAKKTGSWYKKVTIYNVNQVDKFIEMAESRSFEIFGCWICESVIRNPYEHVETKEHKKTWDEL